MRLKSCPRCKTGDLTLDRDHHGWYEYCIQCGYLSDLVSVAESKKKAYGSKKRPIVPDQGDSERA